MSPDFEPNLSDGITARNVRAAAQFPMVPRDLSPELRGPVEKLRAGKVLTDEQIVKMVETDVQHNSNF